MDLSGLTLVVVACGSVSRVAKQIHAETLNVYNNNIAHSAAAQTHFPLYFQDRYLVFMVVAVPPVY